MASSRALSSNPAAGAGVADGSISTEGQTLLGDGSGSGESTQYISRPNPKPCRHVV